MRDRALDDVQIGAQPRQELADATRLVKRRRLKQQMSKESIAKIGQKAGTGAFEKIMLKSRKHAKNRKQADEQQHRL